LSVAQFVEAVLARALVDGRYTDEESTTPVAA
jgi:hypothetical protein